MISITVNADDLLQLARTRAQALGLASGLDDKRPSAWSQYGYKSTLVFTDYLLAYERGGAAHGAVHRLLEWCWQDFPRIKAPDTDDKTPAEKKLAKQLRRLKVWQKFMDFDRRNMVGHYAGLIYRVADGLALKEPMARGELVDVVPLYEDQLKPTAWESDPTSPNYGKPTMWQFRARRVEGNSSEAQAAPDQWVDVHPSRVQILAEGCAGDDFTQGMPLLKPGFNALVDLEKISGGSGEAFLKNAARNLTINFDPAASPQVLTQNADGTASGKTVKQVVTEQVDSLNRSLDTALVFQGAEANTLQTQTADPKSPFEVAACLFAASVRMPFTVLFGQQTGRLASDEDQKDMNRRVASRRVNVLTPAIEEFITRGQAAGWWDAWEFDVEWPDLGAPSDTEKVDRASKMAETNKTASAFGEPVYSTQEIRRAGGYTEPIPAGDLPQLPEAVPTDPGADPNANPQQQGARQPLRQAA